VLSEGTVRRSVAGAADQLSAPFLYTDLGTGTSATVTATLGAVMFPADITIQPARPLAPSVSAGP